MADDHMTLKRFILPEKEISLKLVFDNARNYVIVGAFVAMARWFGSGKVPNLFFGGDNYSYERTVFTLMCVGIAGVLFILNAAQSVGIVKRLLRMLPVGNESGNSRSVKHSRRVMILTRLLTWYFYVAFAVLVVISARMAIYIVWFSATGSGH
ncbi:hypothetical protein GCM10025794_00810 [Massilia kyonggiensis]|nr:hypothetical protein [Massilia kyonggiensis]